MKWSQHHTPGGGPFEAEKGGPVDLAVAVLVDKDGLRRRIRATLSNTTMVKEAHIAQGQSTPAQLANIAKFDILIVSSSNFIQQTDLSFGATVTRPKVLMILDMPHALGPDVASRHPADGYLVSSDLDVDSLRAAISQLAAGHMPLPVDLGRKLFDAVPGRRTALSARECQVLTLVAAGMSNQQIGRRLGISYSGAKHLVGSTLLKLGVPNRAAAVAVGMRDGLIS